MPRAPSIDQQSVELRPLSGARLQSAPTPDYYGAGLGDTTAALGEGLYREQQYQAKKLADEQLHRANQVALMMADAQLSEAQTAIQVKVSKLQAYDALQAPDVAKKEWDDVTQRVMKGANNEDQKVAIQHAVLTRGGHLNQVTQFHVANEMKAFEAKQTDANIALANDEIALNANDPEYVIKTIQKTQYLLDDQAERNGTAGSSTAAEIEKKVVSNQARIAITGMVDAKNDLGAKAFLTKYPDQFTAKDLEHVNKLLAVGSSQGEAFRYVNGIIRPDGVLNESITRKQALEQVDKNLTTPEVNAHAHALVNQHFNEQDGIDAKEHAQNFKAVTNLIEQRPGVPIEVSVPPSLIDKMSMEERKAARQYAAIGTDRENDDLAWVAFNEMTAQQIADMKPEERWNFRNKFDNAHQTRMDAQVNAAMEAKAKHKEVDLTSIQTPSQRAYGIARTSGLWDAKKEPGQLDNTEAARWVHLEQQMDTALQDFQRAQKPPRKATVAEEMQIYTAVKDQAIKDVYVPGSWWGTNQKKAIDLTTDVKGQATVPLSQIPDDKDPKKSERKLLEDYFRSLGQVPTEDKMQRAYAQSLLGNRKLFDQIILGTDKPAPVAPPKFAPHKALTAEEWDRANPPDVAPVVPVPNQAVPAPSPVPVPNQTMPAPAPSAVPNTPATPSGYPKIMDEEFTKQIHEIGQPPPEGQLPPPPAEGTLPQPPPDKPKAMSFTDPLMNLLAKHEGISLVPYKDTRGNMTIGFGHLIKPGETFGPGPITNEQAIDLLKQDVKTAMTSTVSAIKKYGLEVNETRKHALANLMFNVGPAKFAEFRKMIAAMKIGDFKLASQELLKSDWAQHVGTARSLDLAKMIENG